jgi:hypothetical protein
LGFGGVMPIQTLPAAGSYRFGRPLDASVLGLGLQNGPERRAGLGWSERKFLSLGTGALMLLGAGGVIVRRPPVAAETESQAPLSHHQEASWPAMGLECAQDEGARGLVPRSTRCSLRRCGVPRSVQPHGGTG